MPQETTRPGFRFQKIVAWAPAIMLIVAFIFLFMGDIWAGVLLAVAALLFWFLVRRRTASQGPGANPPTGA